jgi:hypothetical protein
MAEQDTAFAERYKDEKKSIDECAKYIMQEAKKQASNGCAAIEDAVVYGWAVHYYQEENIKVGNTTPKAKVVATKVEKPKEIKPIKALVKDKKNENKCVEMDLFAGMF